MKLGFVSAILEDLSLEEVVKFAAEQSLSCVEVMCWPKGRAERRYGGVTHIDVTDFNAARAREVTQLFAHYGVELSALGYYPNPLSADASESKTAVTHIEALIDAAALLGVNKVNTFVGRDPSQSVDENWPRFLEVWRPLIALADKKSVKVGIENCPMLFSRDEWPGGKNLAHSPAIWRRMFSDIPSPNFGLNFDPSHFIWQRMDYLRAVREFKDRIFHVHAKDVRMDWHKLDEGGVLAFPLAFHTPKIPGFGEVQWGKFFSVLSDCGYDGHVCIEVEDRAFEGSLSGRKDSLKLSAKHLRQYILN
jgi:sugar phosphate isomerase/epimerase